MFKQRIRVYYEDTDAGGVVYHSNYLNYMERCRSEWLNQLGYNIVDLAEKEGIIFVVREAKLKYHLPARLFDELLVSCEPSQIGKVSMTIKQSIYKSQSLLCEGEIKLASLNQHSMKIMAMTDTLLKSLKC